MSDDQAESGKNKPCLHVRRVVIEALTPLSPSTGGMDVARDNLITRDMNGLPQLYGPTIGGVLRHIHQDYFGEDATNNLFGFISHGQDDGRESKLEVSFGFVHDASNKPVTGLCDIGRATDEVLSHLRHVAPIKRDRVRLDGRGTVSDMGKFDRASIPAGTRFTIELVLEGEADKNNRLADAVMLDQVVALLQCPYLRLGGGARMAGKIRIVGSHQAGGQPQAWLACFDRSGDDGWMAFEAWRLSRLEDGPGRAGLVQMTSLPPLDRGVSVRKPLTATYLLSPQDFWHFGNGTAVLTRKEPKPADKAPLTEAVISYDSDGQNDEACKGQVRGLETDGLETGGIVLAPFVASGLKGALAHRAEFHLNRLRGHWADRIPESSDAISKDRKEIPMSAQDFNDRVSGKTRGMDTLLGSIKNGDNLDDSSNDASMAGCLFLDDVYLSLPSDDLAARLGTQAHNSLDRFTQGVRDKILFTEEILFRGEVNVSMCLLTKIPSQIKRDNELDKTVETDGFDELPDDVVAAFKMALDDLCQGRLAVGGGGHGYCGGRTEGKDGNEFERWLSAKMMAALETRKQEVGSVDVTNNVTTRDVEAA